MPKNKRGEPYAWLALWALLRARRDDDPPGAEMSNVNALAGRLARPASNAANDLAALALIYLVVWWWTCAKWRAILIGNRPGQVKIIANEWGPEITPQPAPFLALPAFSRHFPPCQIEHLPIRIGIANRPGSCHAPLIRAKKNQPRGWFFNVWVGWLMGLEPTTTGITIRDSTN